MKIGIASDHAGFDLKDVLCGRLRAEGWDVIDFGVDVRKSVDYPDYAEKVGAALAARRIDRGILICGTGIGMSIVANKMPGVRAALCVTTEYARLAREHNDANVLTLGGRFIAGDFAWEITQVFLRTPFLGGRHLRRVNKIKRLDHAAHAA